MSKDSSGLAAPRYWGESSVRESQHTVSKTRITNTPHATATSARPAGNSALHAPGCWEVSGQTTGLTVWDRTNHTARGFSSKKEPKSIMNWVWYQSVQTFRAKMLPQCTDVILGLSAKKCHLYSFLLCLLEEKDLYLQSNNNRKHLMVIDFFLDQETGQPWTAMILIVLGKEKQNAVIYRKQLGVAPRHIGNLSLEEQITFCNLTLCFFF